jgi:hypothetical protein
VAQPVIIATREAEIRRITVQSQPEHCPEDPISKKKKKNHKKGWWMAQGVGPEIKPQFLEKKNLLGLEVWLKQ